MTLFLRFNALVPYDSHFIALSLDENLGDLVIREQGNNINLYSDYVSKGKLSTKIYLKKRKAVN